MWKKGGLRPPRFSVLIADDDGEWIETVEAVLSCHGYRVITARSGLEAWEKGAREEPTVAIVPSSMTGCAGQAVSENLKREYGARVRVIVTSDESDYQSLLLRTDAYADDTLPRSADAERVLDLVHRHHQDIDGDSLANA